MWGMKNGQQVRLEENRGGSTRWNWTRQEICGCYALWVSISIAQSVRNWQSTTESCYTCNINIEVIIIFGLCSTVQQVKLTTDNMLRQSYFHNMLFRRARWIRTCKDWYHTTLWFQNKLAVHLWSYSWKNLKYIDFYNAICCMQEEIFYTYIKNVHLT